MKKLIIAIILTAIVIGCSIQQEETNCLKYGPKKFTYKKWLSYPMDGYIEVEEIRYVCIEWE